MTWREYLNLDDLNLMHGIAINDPKYDAEVPQSVLDKDAEQHRKYMEREAARRAAQPITAESWGLGCNCCKCRCYIPEMGG